MTTVEVVAVGLETEAVVVVGVTIVDVAAPLACTTSVPVAAIGAVELVEVGAVTDAVVSVATDVVLVADSGAAVTVSEVIVLVLPVSL